MGAGRLLSALGAAALLGLGPLGAAPTPAGPSARADLDEALRLVGEGRLALALEAADEEEDPLRRAQARLWVRYHAGDLPGALRAGLAGLETAPDDAWLLAETAEIAASLRLARLTGELAGRLAEAGPAGPEERVERLLAAGRELEAAERARDSALFRARAVVVLGGALLVGALLALARGGSRTGALPQEGPAAPTSRDGRFP